MSQEQNQSFSVIVKQHDTGVTVTIKDVNNPAGQVFDIKHGITPKFDIGTVMTLPADQPATVALKGTEGKLTFEFGIPKGRDGDNVFTFVHPLSRDGVVVSMTAFTPYLNMEQALSIVTVEPGGVYEVKSQVSNLTINAKGKQGKYGEATLVVPFGTNPDIDGDNVTLLDKVYSCETHILKVLFVGTAVLVKVLAHW